jgi:NH3-dependent NAD+ synthetase/predicted amidohydrolase
MKIFLAQLSPVVGAFEANYSQIKNAYERACSVRARLFLTPELALNGYPLYDWIERPELMEATDQALQDLASLTKDSSTALAVGHISLNLTGSGQKFQNSISVFEGGKCIFHQSKTLLPSYDVFDEPRYFEPASDLQVWDCDGVRVAFGICEDLWGRSLDSKQRRYHRDPILDYQRLGAQFVLSLSSSPYEWEKRKQRERTHQEIAKTLKVPVVYVNQVGATDELLFDGGSFAVDAHGTKILQLPYFEAGEGWVALDGQGALSASSVVADLSRSPEDEWEILSQGLIVGIRDYFLRTGFKRAVLGLSGGIDSALVAVLAVAALGSENVLALAMPSQYSSSHSLEDAEILAKKLGIRLEVRPIKFAFSTLSRELSEDRGQLKSVALENLQSRLRGTILMTLANQDSSLVLTTGNKSEIAMGYCTLYGDMNGALAPLGDLYKTQVYLLVQYWNQSRGDVIPARILSKAPSAELRPNQTDQDSLPPYEVLDRFLLNYLEENLPLKRLEVLLKDQLPASGVGSVQDLASRVNLNEYKRHQSAPILRVSKKAFGLGRRVPIAKKY